MLTRPFSQVYKPLTPKTPIPITASYQISNTSEIVAVQKAIAWLEARKAKIPASWDSTLEKMTANIAELERTLDFLQQREKQPHSLIPVPPSIVPATASATQLQQWIG